MMHMRRGILIMGVCVCVCVCCSHCRTSAVVACCCCLLLLPVVCVLRHTHTGGSAHRNPWRCAAAIYDTHGLSGFWRGWLANYARLGPQTVMTFLVVEQLRSMAGMGPL
jgi:solute carrier family 25 uncoupling protein 8/9